MSPGDHRRRILSMAGLQVADADLLAAGPPCQPFSQAGLWARGGTARIDDPRAETLIAFMRAWRAILPRAVLMESVPGLVHGGTDVVDYIGREISAINREHGTHYELLWTVLNSADYGVPQLRRRFVLVSSREGRPFEFPEPTHHDGGQLQFGAAGAVPHRTAWDAIGDLKPPADGLEPTGRWAELLRSIPEGENYLFHTERGGGEPLFGWRRRYWSFLLKLAKSRPSWTIPAEPGSATGPFHWNSRRLSTRELCRLQTIPDDVEIVGSYRSAHRQIGNAVPSLLAEVLGRAIRRQLFDDAGLDRKLILLPPDRSPPPPAEQPTPVPNHYLAAGSSDTPHPGTGLGRAALERRRATLAPPAASQSVSAVMRGNRSTDTRPERLLRSALHRRGYRFRKSYRIAFDGGSVRADIAFPKRRLAVFVDGCFWHQCPWHGNVPRANSTYWATKLARNVERDKRVSRALEDNGWRVVRIWEHVQCADAADQVMRELAEGLAASNHPGRPGGATRRSRRRTPQGTRREQHRALGNP